MKHEKYVPYLICRRLGRSTVKVIFLFHCCLLLVQCFTIVRKKKKLLKSPEACCEAVQPVAMLGLRSFIGVAVLLHFCSSHTNAHLENTSVTPHGNLCICYYCIHRMRCSGQCNYAKSSQLPNTLKHSLGHRFTVCMQAAEKKKNIYIFLQVSSPHSVRTFWPRLLDARRGLMDVKSVRKCFAAMENRGPAVVGDCQVGGPDDFKD